MTSAVLMHCTPILVMFLALPINLLHLAGPYGGTGKLRSWGLRCRHGVYRAEDPVWIASWNQLPQRGLCIGLKELQCQAQGATRLWH